VDPLGVEVDVRPAQAVELRRALQAPVGAVVDEQLRLEMLDLAGDPRPEPLAERELLEALGNTV